MYYGVFLLARSGFFSSLGLVDPGREGWKMMIPLVLQSIIWDWIGIGWLVGFNV